MVGLLLPILDIYCNRKFLWQSVNLYLHRTTKKSAAANEDCQRGKMALAVVITRPTITFYKKNMPFNFSQNNACFYTEFY